MAKPQHDTTITLKSASLQLDIDLYGGAITGVRRHDIAVNPLSFRFTKKQMPTNNRKGAPYRGHFACIGRWGEPSPGEIKAGLPNHGAPANMLWQRTGRQSGHTLHMGVNSKLEGLQVQRSVTVDQQDPVFHVTETITNTNPLGRLLQVVQHPTLAAPFLSDKTVVNCNATKGFEYRHAIDNRKNLCTFPHVQDDAQQKFNLCTPGHPFNSVYSFIIDPKSTHGWITAYAPEHRLLFGYVWPRRQYPWISLWQHFDNGHARYRGLEFGNTGIHQPYQEIIAHNLLNVLGERTADWIDAGATQVYRYTGFMCIVQQGFPGVKKIALDNDTITIYPVKNGQPFTAGKINGQQDYVI